MAFQVLDSLPGIRPNLIDGNLQIATPSTAPRVLIIGTAERGRSDQVYNIRRMADANTEFGTSGTLLRGAFEAQSGGATNISLLRIGATAAKLEYISSTDPTTTAGQTLYTVKKDDSAGTDYKLTYDSTNQILRVWRVSDDVKVYEYDPANPANKVDLGDVYVSGTLAANDSTDIVSGTGDSATGFDDPDNAVTFDVAESQVGLTGNHTNLSVAYTAGTDGLSLSKMRLYEELYKAYQLLVDTPVDIVVPMDVYLDEKNVADGDTINVSSNTYPSAGGDNDGLGKVFIQEYNNEYYFWWDTDGDGVAELYPSVGSAANNKDANGNSLTAASFHEVNFAYQLARFCYALTANGNPAAGVIGVRPPVSFGLTGIRNWIGQLPTYQTDSNGNVTVSANGSGLLGNKWVSGSTSFRNADQYGGFILTDTDFSDGTEQTDDNGSLVDIGKHLSIVAEWPIMRNGSQATAYVASGAALYAGLDASLAPSSAPTNKTVPGARLPYTLLPAKINAMAAQRMILFRSKGTVRVSDAPTAARPTSDYNRRTTFKIVADVLERVKRIANPFIGESGTDLKYQALKGLLEKEFALMVQEGSLQKMPQMQVSATPAQRVAGELYIDLKLVPAFEVREIHVPISLSAE